MFLELTELQGILIEKEYVIVENQKVTNGVECCYF
jgi:hypothetical protein